MSYSATKSSVKINWSKLPEADGYVIQQYKNDKWVIISKLDSDTTSYTVNGLTSGKKYRLRIKPYADVDGETVYGFYINYAVHTK